MGHLSGLPTRTWPPCPVVRSLVKGSCSNIRWMVLPAKRDSPRTGNLDPNAKPSTWFAGEIPALAHIGDKLIDLTQDLIGGHQVEVLRVWRYNNLAFGEFSTEDSTVEILKFQTG